MSAADSHPIPTDFSAFVVDVLARHKSRPLDQHILRRSLSLASSFLVTDATMNPLTGLRSWSVGFHRLIDIILALHSINELEIDTISAGSKACSECWSAISSWPNFDDGRQVIGDIATKLKGLLDDNKTTYRGQAIYAP